MMTGIEMVLTELEEDRLRRLRDGLSYLSDHFENLSVGELRGTISTYAQTAEELTAMILMDDEGADTDGVTTR